MKEAPLKKSHYLVLTGLLLVLFAGQARAELLFSEQGDDLLVTITDPIVFTATEEVDPMAGSLFMVIFKDVFTLPNSAQHGGMSSGDTTLTLFPGTSSRRALEAGQTLTTRKGR